MPHCPLISRTPIVALALATALSIAPCAAAAQTVAAREPPRPRNLQVLPADLSRDSVVKIMRSVVASGLGVGCAYCHGAPGIPFDSIDYASDERPTKRTAREMMRMVARINGELLGAIPGRGAPPLDVACITCHRGASRPLMLEDTLGTVITRFGPDSAVATYQRLKARYLGRFAYDFGQRSLNTLAGRLVEQNRLADARRMLELNVREHPDLWDAAYELARVYERLGERTLAVEQYRRVVALLPTHAPSRRRLQALTGSP